MASTPIRSKSKSTAATAKRFIALVGLPDAAVKESRDRVSTALSNSGYKFPDGQDHHQPRAGRCEKGRAEL
jgi:hypothetical protein